MTSKERAALRAQANKLEPLFQVGKGGVNDALIAQTLDAFRSRELLKLKVLLETAPKSAREIAEEIAKATDSEVVQVIGGSMIFYKENLELRNPQKKPQKKEIKGTKNPNRRSVRVKKAQKAAQERKTAAIRKSIRDRKRRERMEG